MEYFIVNTNDDNQNDHEVHRLYNCNHLPHPAHRRELGYFYSSQSALDAALQIYPTADGCYYCCPEIHHS